MLERVSQRNTTCQRPANSKRLVEVALQAGSRASCLVDLGGEVDEAGLEGVSTVGVTSGASAPEVLVGEVLEWLAHRGHERRSRRPRSPSPSRCRRNCAGICGPRPGRDRPG